MHLLLLVGMIIIFTFSCSLPPAAIFTSFQLSIPLIFTNNTLLVLIGS